MGIRIQYILPILIIVMTSSVLAASLDSKTLGDSSAEVTIEMFTDFQGPFCAKWHTQTLPLIKENYLDKGKVKLVIKHFPLDFHPDAETAAIAAECAADQGEFFEYIELLYNDPGALSDSDLRGYGVDLGLEIDSFDICIASAETKKVVDADVKEGNEKGIEGTPTFFINGEEMVGAQPYSAFEKTINDALGNEPSESCTEKGFICTSKARGCGLDYKQLDYDCPEYTICCEAVSYCGDGICDTEIDYPESEKDTCPEDCGEIKEEEGDCEDSDGGMNYYEKGEVISELNIYIYEDFCNDETSLEENYCSDTGRIASKAVECPFGCKDGACVKKDESSEKEPIELPEEEKEKKTDVCNGCVLEDRCFPYGHRKDGKYCSDDQNFTIQLDSNTACENSFQCQSNLCAAGECISQGLIQKILAWFGKFFGGM